MPSMCRTLIRYFRKDITSKVPNISLAVDNNFYVPFSPFRKYTER